MLQLSSRSKLGNESGHGLLFNKKAFEKTFAFHPENDSAPYILVDLGKTYSVTGPVLMKGWLIADE